MKKIMILSNDHAYTYNLRKEVIQELIDSNYEVYIVLPYGEKVELLKEMGCHFIDVPFNGRGKNPIEDIQLLNNYQKIIKNIKPDAVLTYTIKPNLYGGLICKKMKIPFYPNITGLGTAIENESILQKVLIRAYKYVFQDATCVFFQNKDNYQVFVDKEIELKKHRIIPGSGVNTERFSLMEYPRVEDGLNFVYISRIMKEKGIDQYLEAAKIVRNKYSGVSFNVVGNCDDNYKEIIEHYSNEGIIEYHGVLSDVREILAKTHCTIHPTYYPEGLSNILLESAASGKPLISTDRVGTKEVIDHGENGYLINEEDSGSLIEAIERFIKLPYEEKKEMGLASRRKVESDFDRQIVVEAYIEELSYL